MTDIIVEKVNEVYVRVNCEDRGIYLELEKFFAFRPPKYMFDPLFKKKIWDGYIRPFSPNARLLYVGLLGHLKEFAKEANYKIGVYDKQRFLPKYQYNESDLDSFLESLPLSVNGEDITINPHQREAIHTFLQDIRNIMLLPTSSGKSLILYCLVRYFLQRNENILIVVPTVNLVNQLKSDFADYSSKDKSFDCDELIHLIFAGEDKVTKKPITITTYQSVAQNKRGSKVSDTWGSKFGVVMVDEAHTAESKSIKGILEGCTNASYRLGVTGTLDFEKTNPTVLVGLLGKIKKIITTKELQDLGVVSKLKINCLLLQYDEESRKAAIKAEYDDEIKFIVKNEKRNKLIRNLSLSLSGNTLILCNYVDNQLIPVYNLIKEKAGDRKVLLYYGDIDPKERERMRLEIDKYKDAIIVSNYKTLSTGVNIKSIQNVIFAHPLKSMVTILQSIGRGLRLFKGKTVCNLFDISDDLSFKGKKNKSLEHFLSRLEIYDKENFEYKINKINLG